MLINDLRAIGNNLLLLRKKRGLTQAELAEKAGLSDRTYADIERGTVNMRLQTLLKICEALNVLPNDILSSNDIDVKEDQKKIIERLKGCAVSNQETAIKLVKVYLDSLMEK